MTLAEKIEGIIADSVTHLGYDIVRVSVTGNELKTIQVMIERTDRADMTVDDCEKVSRTVSALLDVEDPVAGRYMLEVTSPGIDRPLIKPADYVRFKGMEAKVETMVALNNQRRFKGIIMGVSDDESEIILSVDGNTIRLPFNNIAKAKLILTDELLAQHAKQHKGE